jgi:CO/xanthine dehydrogenase FAD-binding subunit
VKLHPAQAHRLRIERYVAPGSIEEALAALAESDGRARLIAGGTDLLLEMGRGQRPDLETLIDLTRVAGLDEIALVGEGIEVGATVTHGRVATSPCPWPRPVSRSPRPNSATGRRSSATS